MTEVNTVLLYCRSGFEKECAAEITTRCAEVGIYGYPQFENQQGYVLFRCHESDGAITAMRKLRFRSLIFARQWIACAPCLENLSSSDRISPIAILVAELPPTSELMVEVADTTEGRELHGFARKFSSALAQALRREGLMQPRKQRADWRLHVFVVDGRTLWVGVAALGNSSSWPMGVLRLKFPQQAPSRSTLKLDEAWHYFIPQRRRDELLRGGMSAVDLGAAPGGWTWQLVNQHMFVTAVDNGPMNEDLMESGQVEHRREDAFTFVPSKPVDWMVCDVVDKPARVTELMLSWALNGWCRNAIFNLKLPMKQRFDEVERCLGYLRAELDAADIDYRLQARHLYHDREEITCWLSLTPEG
ncbi:23S rRNA (cytidine(2498)-2'-O)-methyltransferase RlmM [Marinobacterium sediminicola]|uniref:Ribosomal RNA large subunit methyltransferase M n=1 Tax=Marinobacterium sediminicola TaxID=518898 RepID=A0ABY1RVP9_9GAMM|nr:23S rRNA (cytidine(2498)-2'-O)-methyltransferase RlmM [Marinobacterium sediminicola]ULG70587.1 23S rRNA (cytidine(2498)-2'-O)-methyltransferase RlmM [Marinobacterium sediminicola]SMR68931.1 23S rRNA (cytidine2498-2'-O)-methyltransferase [Marinobacterium sediminicola]